MASTTDIRALQYRASPLLAVAPLAVAAVSLVWFSVVPSIAFLLAAVMCWSRPFDDNKAKGKPTLSTSARCVIGAGFAAMGGLFLWLPGMIASDVKPEAPSFGVGEAASICKDAARDRITHPSTADFSILGIGFRSFDDGTSILTTTFTARNGFNLKLEYQVACDFTGSSLTDITIVEAR